MTTTASNISTALKNHEIVSNEEFLAFASHEHPARCANINFANEIALREKYNGRVLRVWEEEREIRMSDYSDYYWVLLVTVWDEDEERGLTFEAVTVRENLKVKKSIWSVDGTPSAYAAYNEWIEDVQAPREALHAANEKHDQVIRKGEVIVSELLIPEPQRGQEWQVFKGRKVKVGTKGRVFWSGSTKWGVTVGLALTDRKGKDGRFLDTVFVSRDNLTYQPTDADHAKANEIREDYKAAARAAWRETYDAVHSRALNNKLLQTANS